MQPSDHFKFLWMHPDQPDMAKAADWLFTDPHSPWVPLINMSNRFSASWDLQRMLTSSLLNLAPFRTLVLQGLANTHHAGVITVSATGDRLDFQMDNGWRTGVGDAGEDALKPAPNAKIDIRICDMYAADLSGVIGAPRCEPLLVAGETECRRRRLCGVPAPLCRPFPLCAGHRRAARLSE